VHTPFQEHTVYSETCRLTVLQTAYSLSETSWDKLVNFEFKKWGKTDVLSLS